jgi:predicted cupin superfamily sugar epimerase
MNAPQRLPDASRAEDTPTALTLEPGEFVPFHRLKVEESWSVAAGDPVQLHLIHTDGEYQVRTVDTGPSLVVPSNSLRAARLVPGGRMAIYARRALTELLPGLVEVPSASDILREHPLHESIVRELTRG